MGQLDQHRIELAAGRKTSDRQVQRDGTAHGGQPEGGAEINSVLRAATRRGGLVRINALFQHPRCGDGHARIFHQRRRGAAGNIGAKPHMQPFFKCGAQREYRIREIHI